MSTALAAGDFERCLQLLLEFPQVPNVQVVEVLETAMGAQRPDIVAQLIGRAYLRGHGLESGSGVATGRPLPPRALRLGVLGALETGQLSLATELIAHGRKLHPDKAIMWDALHARHSAAVARTSAAGRLAETADAAMEQEDWPTACALVRNYREHPERDWARYAQLAEKVHDPAGVLRAEAELLAECGPDAVGALPPTAALPFIRARLHFGRSAEALQLARRLRDLHPVSPQLAQNLCQLLARQQDHAAALSLAQEGHAAGARWAIQTVVGSLVAMGELGACETFLLEATRTWKGSNRRPVALAWAAFWLAREAPDKALAAVLADVERFPEGQAQQTIARFADAARDTGLLHAQLARLDSWSEASEGPALLRRFGPAILQVHFGRLLNWGKVAPHAQRLARLVLAPPQAASLARLFTTQGDFQTARGVLEQSLTCFPASVALHRAALNALGRLNDAAGCSRARAFLRQHLPADVAMDVLLGADPGSWDPAELPVMLKHALDMEDASAQSTFFISLRRVRLMPSQLGALLDHAALADRPALLARTEFILAQCVDRQMLEDAVQEPLPYAAFVARQSAVRRRLGGAVDRVIHAQSGPASYISKAEQDWVAECAGQIRMIEAKAPIALLQTADCYADAVALSRILLERLRDKVPTSVLRLGDGEGHFMPPIASVALDLDADRDFIQRIWWGNRALDPAAANAFQEALTGSVDRADVLGVPPAWRLVRDLKFMPSLAPQHRGILNGLAHVARMPRMPGVITSAHLHHDLHVWNLWREILGAVSHASWISCHDLTPHLHDMCGVATREGILIPAEHRWAGLFGRPAAEAVAQEALLDRHDALCAALDPEPGELWLVAAGSLGKIHCDIIRARGGFAIDIGSLADYWMGFATRDYATDKAAEPALSNILVPGHPLAGHEDQARILGLPNVVRSTRDGSRNRALPEDAAAFAVAPAPSRLLRIIGHPRCASGYMATVFAAHGLEVGHEALLRDGIASWMHVVADLCLPYGDNASLTRFERTVVHVRDPADAVPSIMLENGLTRSFDFRRQHILRATGVDISAYRTAVERATASLVHWVDMAMAKQPDAVFQVEAAEADVAAWLRRDPVMRRVVVVGGDGPAEGVARYNNSARRFDRAKPVLTPADFRDMDAELRVRLAKYCKRFGYTRPWLPP